MSLLMIVGVLVLAGVLLWAVEQFPLDGTIKNLIRVVVIVGAVVYILQTFNMLPN